MSMIKTKETIIQELKKKQLSFKNILKLKELISNDASDEAFDKFSNGIVEEKIEKFSITVEPGVGGLEAELWAKDLFNMYSKFLTLEGCRFELEDSNNLLVHNTFNVFQKLQYETGIHRVQRIPATEKIGRVQTSTAAVLIQSKLDIDMISLEDLDLTITSAKGRGKGGQNVNKRNNMIRIVDNKTNTHVRADGRLKVQNLEAAKKKILENVQQSVYEEHYESLKASRKLVADRNRSQKIRTYSYKENRVVDHINNVTVNSLTDIIKGKLNILLDKINKKNKAD